MNLDPFFVLMIITHQNNFKNPPSWPATYQEYLEGLPWIKVITIYGGNEPSEEIKKTLPETGNYQHIPVSDYYENLPQKVIGGIKHIFAKWPTIKGIFKIDDDIEIVNMPEFIINAINLIANNTHYAGITTSVANNFSNYHLGKCQDKSLNIALPLNPNITYCGGPLYFLGGASIRLLATSTEYSINTIYEDNLIGYILNTYGKITPIRRELYHDLPILIKHRIKPGNKVLAIHNAEHSPKLLLAYFQKFNLPSVPHRHERNQTNANEENDLLEELSGVKNSDDYLGDSLSPSNTIIALEQVETAQKTHTRHHLINNTYIISRNMLYLLHKNNVSNYITLIGGFCNNLFQISAAWYYQLSYGGNYVKCIPGTINKSQITDEIWNYYQNNLFPPNTRPTKIYRKQVYINRHRDCFNYLGNIYEPTKVIIHNDYFQNLRYINSFNLATLWRHILNIDNISTSGLFDKHANQASGINWLANQSDFISVHIRLGDYTQSAIHNIDLSTQIQKITGDILMADFATRLIFFTNDIDILSKNISNYINIVDYPDRYLIINEPDPLNTLKLMASCRKGHILANSSFSLWGAILNPNPDKIVYLPRKWLNTPEGANITESFKDICRNAVFF